MGCGLVSQRRTNEVQVHRGMPIRSNPNPDRARRDAPQEHAGRVESEERHGAEGRGRGRPPSPSSSPSPARTRSASNASSDRDREREGRIRGPGPGISVQSAMFHGQHGHYQGLHSNALRSPQSPQGLHRDHELPVGLRARGPSSRRQLGAECVSGPNRQPQINGSVQDHAFCFQCGVFFNIGSVRPPQCTECNGSFVQILRSNNEQNWITSDMAASRGYISDDQLQSSLSASMDEAPTNGKATKASFVKGMPTLLLGAEEVAKRSECGNADPKCHCAICRETFATGEVLKSMPCKHEFHEACIDTWLQTHNTCPICRWNCPEADDKDANPTPQQVELGGGQSRAILPLDGASP